MKSKHTAETMTNRNETTCITNLHGFIAHIEMMIEADSDFYLKDISSLPCNAEFTSYLNKIEEKYAQISKLNFKEIKAAYKYFSTKNARARDRAQKQLFAIQEESTELINKEIS